METISSALIKTVRFSLPMVGVRLISAFNGFIAMLMIAKLGHAALAAGALIAAVQVTVSVTGYSLLFSMSVVVGRLFGERKYEEAGQTLRQGFLLCLLSSIPMFLIYFNIGPILYFFHQPKHLINLVVPYFHILAFGTVPWMIFIGLSQFLAGTSKPHASFQFGFLSLIFFLLPSYALLFGHFGLPKLGIPGVAVASTFTGYAMVAVIFTYLFFSPYYRHFKIFTLAKVKNWEHLKKLFNIGFPIVLQTAAELSAFSFMTFMIGWLGETPLAAQQIVIQLASIIVMFPYGIGQSSGILIGQALGRGDHQATRKFGEAGLLLGIALSLLVVFIYLVFPKSLIQLFSLNAHNASFAATIHLTIILLAVDAFAELVDSIRNIAVGALRGFHDSKIPMINSFIVCWAISIPLGYILCFPAKLGVVGVKIAFLIAATFGAATMIKRLYNKTSLTGPGISPII